VASSKMLI